VSAPVVEARGLGKRYDEIVAVDGVNLTIEAGDVYGFLGPNGAGKTTTLRMLLGLITPSAGSSRLFGRDPMLDGTRALDGVAGFVEAPRFYPYLTARRNLELCAAFDGGGASDRIGEALDVVELTDRAKHKVGGYSHGMRQRLGVAAALIRSPRLLILDEPQTGLDPAGIRDMRNLVRRLSDQGMTVLLSSHVLAEVEEICNRVAIILAGRILYEGDLPGLRSRTSQTTGYALRTTDDAAAGAVLGDRFGPVTVTGGPDADAGMLVGCGEGEVGAISLALAAEGIGVLSLTSTRRTLEDIFLELTGDASAAAAEPVPGRLAEVR
jgi:ABC-2 type transport system ATP-binding protein